MQALGTDVSIESLRLQHRLQQRYTIIKQSVELAFSSRLLFSIANADQVLEQSLRNASASIIKTNDQCLVEPYWAEHWQTAFAMDHDWEHLQKKYLASKYILSNCLELGCGGGVLSLALACRNIPIIATDYASDALLLTRLNATVNRQRILTRRLDWNKPSLFGKFDVIVAADIVYDRRSFESLHRCLTRYLSDEGTCIIGEPSRSMGDEFIHYLLGQGWCLLIEDSKQPEIPRKVRYLVIRKRR